MLVQPGHRLLLWSCSDGGNCSLVHSMPWCNIPTPPGTGGTGSTPSTCCLGSHFLLPAALLPQSTPLACTEQDRPGLRGSYQQGSPPTSGEGLGEAGLWCLGAAQCPPGESSHASHLHGGGWGVRAALSLYPTQPKSLHIKAQRAHGQDSSAHVQWKCPVPSPTPDSRAAPCILETAER